MTTSDPELADRALLEAFESAAIPRERWTHRTHLRVAYLLLRDLGPDAGLAALRRGIPKLNRALGVEEGPESGYHETITVAWARIVRAAIEQAAPSGQTSSEFLDLHPELSSPRALLRHYTHERIMSPEAKRAFVAPDLQVLP